MDHAQIIRNGDGTVTINDPGAPITITVRVDTTGKKPSRITQLDITARHPDARITPAALARIPLSQIRAIAAGSVSHPNAMMWLSRIQSSPAGSRSWGPEHWRTILDVADWATATGYPGGPSRAVADLWDVSRDPTAYRWLTKARATRTAS